MNFVKKCLEPIAFASMMVIIFGVIVLGSCKSGKDLASGCHSQKIQPWLEQCMIHSDSGSCYVRAEKLFCKEK